MGVALDIELQAIHLQRFFRSLAQDLSILRMPIDVKFRFSSSRCCALRNILIFYASPRVLYIQMITCHLSTLMGREKFRIADVARITGLNRSTVSALYKGTCTRVEMTTIEQLCILFKCQVGDILEFMDEGSKVRK